MITKIQNLLSQVDTLIKKNNEILDATGSRFNIFGIFWVNHYENTPSAIIAEFLNPKRCHALGDKLLVEFLKTINLADFEFDTKQAKITTELSGGDNGRMDIVIESNGKAVIIENKIYAGDQEE